MKRVMLVIAAAVLASSCQTTNMQMRARTAPPGIAPGTVAACLRAADRRADCEDQVGCAWDYDAGTCDVSH